MRKLTRRDATRRVVQLVSAFAVLPLIGARARATESCVDADGESLRESMLYTDPAPNPEQSCQACAFFTAEYAAQNQDNIKGIAFMEGILKPAKWSEFPADFKTGFKLFRTDGIGWFMISVMNVFVEKILPQATGRQLSKTEMDYYRAPYPTISSRKPLRQWPREIPIDGSPADVHQIVTEYNKALQEMECPKILFHAKPGGLITEPVVEWCKQNLKNLTAIDIGEGIHFVQESSPDRIGESLGKWYHEMTSA